MWPGSSKASRVPPATRTSSWPAVRPRLDLRARPLPACVDQPQLHVDPGIGSHLGRQVLEFADEVRLTVAVMELHHDEVAAVAALGEAVRRQLSLQVLSEIRAVREFELD